jgi:predicted MFS family arabinose efflux permease
MLSGRLISSVLLPFAAGYFLSYVFRTVNAVIATDLAADLDLNAAQLGLLTGIYFLVFATVQLPLGALLDRIGPTIVQSALVLFAGAGALVFAFAQSFAGLMLGRVLTSLGVAAALMAGVKAIGVWFPARQWTLATGWLVALGALGALTATTPTDLLTQAIGWRGVFVILAGLSALSSLLVLVAAPDCNESKGNGQAIGSLLKVYRDKQFWRVAPLSALGVGTSWSLQGLWAAPWLRDVEGLERSAIVHHLTVMAMAVCVGALCLGSAAHRLRLAGIKPETILAATLSLSALAQLALILQWPFPPLLAFTVIAAAGAATVLSFASVGSYFPKAIAGRANGALNLLHVGAAFTLQYTTGVLIAQWPETQGRYPAEAHRSAMAILLGLQLTALVWFGIGHCVTEISFTSLPAAMMRRLRAEVRFHFVRAAEDGWQVAAFASILLCVVLAMVVVSLVRTDVPQSARWSMITTSDAIVYAHLCQPE